MGCVDLIGKHDLITYLLDPWLTAYPKLREQNDWNFKANNIMRFHRASILLNVLCVAILFAAAVVI